MQTKREEEKKIREFIGERVSYNKGDKVIYNGNIIIDFTLDVINFAEVPTQDEMIKTSDALGEWIADAINQKLSQQEPARNVKNADAQKLIAEMKSQAESGIEGGYPLMTVWAEELLLVLNSLSSLPSLKEGKIEEVSDEEMKERFEKVLTTNEFENGYWYELSLTWEKEPEILVNIMRQIWTNGARWMRDKLQSPPMGLSDLQCNEIHSAISHALSDYPVGNAVLQNATDNVVDYLRSQFSPSIPLSKSEGKEERKKEAVAFLEWAEAKHFWKSTDTRFQHTLGRWTVHINGDVELKDTFSTSELYDLFIQSK